MRKKRPIKREPSLNRDASLVVIASEDQYAVKQYFEFFRSTRIQFRVLETTDCASAPEHVLDRLSQYMQEYQFGEGDTFWFVCDTDHWIESGHIANLVKVVRQCRQKGIGVAISNPCFELWLLLHFDEFPTEDSLTCKELEERIRSVVGQYKKTRVFELPISDESVRNAIARSKANQKSSGEIPTQVQTAMHLIIDELIARGVISVSQ